MKSNKVSISVVMSIFNEKEDWLIGSISSIINQSFKDFEFIIINDNPNKELNDHMLDKFRLTDSRIIIVNNNENLGLTKSLNIGFKKARGKYIARMDADDISLPERLARQFDFMENNKEIVACGSFIRVFGKINKTDKSLPTNCNQFKNILLIKNPLPHPTAFIRNEIIQKNNIKYDERYKYSQDYGLWSELSIYGFLTNIPEVLLHYRVADNQISIKNKKEQTLCAQSIRRELLKRELKNIHIQFDINSLSHLALKIYNKLDKNEYRSYMLLLLFLSYINYNVKDVVLLIYRVNAKVLVLNFKLIVQRVFFSRQYQPLL
jgi:glycosyltransferase involved in cell wall biosynthesis